MLHDFICWFQISTEQGIPKADVMAEANAILDEMAHTLNMTAIRGFAYALVKVFKALFNRVYVNTEGIQQVSTKC